MAVKPVTSRSSELCERAARACAASRDAAQAAKDSIVTAKARADHFGRKSDAHDWVLQSLLAR